jgi:hypothetical protein
LESVAEVGEFPAPNFAALQSNVAALSAVEGTYLASSLLKAASSLLVVWEKTAEPTITLIILSGDDLEYRLCLSSMSVWSGQPLALR